MNSVLSLQQISLQIAGPGDALELRLFLLNEQGSCAGPHPADRHSDSGAKAAAVSDVAFLETRGSSVDVKVVPSSSSSSSSPAADRKTRIPGGRAGDAERAAARGGKRCYRWGSMQSAQPHVEVPFLSLRRLLDAEMGWELKKVGVGTDSRVGCLNNWSRADTTRQCRRSVVC